MLFLKIAKSNNTIFEALWKIDFCQISSLVEYRPNKQILKLLNTVNSEGWLNYFCCTYRCSRQCRRKDDEGRLHRSAFTSSFRAIALALNRRTFGVEQRVGELNQIDLVGRRGSEMETTSVTSAKTRDTFF